MQKEFLAAYRKKYPITHPTGEIPLGEEKYVAPPGYDDTYDHLKNFFEAVRTRRPGGGRSCFRISRRRSRPAQQSQL